LQNNSVTTTYRSEDFEDDVRRLGEIRNEVGKLYVEKKAIEKRVLDHMRETDIKETPIDERTKLTMAWAYDKRIDYERLETLYPDVYRLGLIATFSKNHAVMAMDGNTLNMILRDCTTADPHFVPRYEKRKHKKRRIKNE
jgi:hypothetical protein